MQMAGLACVAILAVLGLGFYAVRKMRPGSLRLQTSVWRVFSFTMVIESDRTTEKPADSSPHDLAEVSPLHRGG
jgi:hypothetical protein